MDEKLATREIRAAIKQGDAEHTLALIHEDKSRLTMQTIFGTWLHVAASKGDLEIVKRLVAMGADVDANGGIAGGTPLHLAADDGHVDVVRFLISSGAKLDVSKPERNPLFAAIRSGHTAIVRMLINAGIDTSVKYKRPDPELPDRDAFAYAREWGRNEIVALLGGTPIESQTTESAPSKNDQRAVREGARAAAKMLGLSDKDAPAAMVKRIQQYLEDFAAGTAENPLGDDVAVALGALWGNAVCDEHGWEWIVPKHGDWTSLGVADPERRYLGLPLTFFKTIMFEDPDEEMPGPLVRFNAIGTDTMPNPDPGTYMIITS